MRAFPGWAKPCRMRRLAALALSVLLLCGCGGEGGGAEPSARAKALLATLPAAYRGADIENGKTVFNLCRSCHTAIAGGAVITGPNLHGVFGRKAGVTPGYAYSSALSATGWTWDAGRLHGWLKDPRTAVPGTKMTFVGISDDKDRRDLIAYLRLVTEDAAP